VPELQRLRADHAPAVLAFELANRVYFAASISDRGDEFYDRFTERHGAMLAEQEADIGAFYVLVAEDGSVLGRFNLYRFEDGTAELGYRVAQHVAGRGVATATVRELCGLAAAQYGLRTLKAATSRENAASQKVLARAGFIPVGPAGPADLGGKQGTWYQRDLVQSLSSSLPVRGHAVSRSCGPGKVLLPGVAFEVAGVVSIGVVAPLVRMRGLVVPDGELSRAGTPNVGGAFTRESQRGV
jgi:[ribosomal protein S5]-alanine N-acetyltransferase